MNAPVGIPVSGDSPAPVSSAQGSVAAAPGGQNIGIQKSPAIFSNIPEIVGDSISILFERKKRCQSRPRNPDIAAKEGSSDNQNRFPIKNQFVSVEAQIGDSWDASNAQNRSALTAGKKRRVKKF